MSMETNLYQAHIVLFHAKNDLAGHDALVRILEVQVWVQGEACRVFEDVSCDWAILHHIGHRPWMSVSILSKGEEPKQLTFLVHS